MSIGGVLVCLFGLVVHLFRMFFRSVVIALLVSGGGIFVRRGSFVVGLCCLLVCFLGHSANICTALGGHDKCPGMGMLKVDSLELGVTMCDCDCHRKPDAEVIEMPQRNA